MRNIHKLFFARAAFAVVVFSAALFALSCASTGTRHEDDDSFADMISMLEREPRLPAEMLAWYSNEAFEAYDYKNYLIIKCTRDSFTGGAHGLSTVEYAMFDRDKKSRIRFGDLVSPDNMPVFMQTVNASLRKQYGLASDAPLSEAGFFLDNVVDMPLHFFLSDSGLTLHWNPYDIAPYSFGPIEVTVPLNF